MALRYERDAISINIGTEVWQSGFFALPLYPRVLPEGGNLEIRCKNMDDFVELFKLKKYKWQRRTR